jgi:hypothetical protein
MTSMTTRACPPGSSVPRAQTSSPSDSVPVAAVTGLAGGAVVTNAVPKGIASRSVTSWAVALPTFRTRIS